MNLSDETRQHIVNLAMKFQGIPYIWGGSTPRGFDCSGLIVWCLQVFDVLPGRGDWGSATLSRMFRETSDPKPGDLAFYGTASDAVSHVMMCAGVMGNQGMMVVGASGGGHATTTEEDAVKIGAMVKVKPMHYRGDFLFTVNIDELIPQ